MLNSTALKDFFFLPGEQYLLLSTYHVTSLANLSTYNIWQKCGNLFIKKYIVRQIKKKNKNDLYKVRNLYKFEMKTTSLFYIYAFNLNFVGFNYMKEDWKRNCTVLSNS